MDLGIGGLERAEVIGAGGSAVVYRAYQADLDREVAVKVLKLTDESFVKRFQREARTLGKLSQRPGIVTIYDNGLTDDGRPYLILEFCDSSLHDQLKDGPFDMVRACGVVAEITEAVAAAHDNDIVHRDLKPGNILVSPLGRYLVADFGISAVGDTSAGDTGSIGFTAGYVAPEILMENQADKPADVYALGATLYHLLAGQPPFVDPEENANLFAMAQRVISDTVPDLADQGVDPRVNEIVQQAMAKDPSDRPTADELAKLLRDLLQELSHLESGTEAPTMDPRVGGDTTVVDAGGGAHSPELITGSGSVGIFDRPAGNVTAVAAQSDPAGIKLGAEPYGGRSGLAVPVYDDDDEIRRRRMMTVGGAVAAALLLGALLFIVPRLFSGDDSADVAAVETTEVASPDTAETGADSQSAAGSTDDLEANSRFDTAAVDTTVDVPNVIGMDITKARAALEEAGLIVSVTSRRSSSTPPDTVVETSPAAGEVVDLDSTVTVVVARRVETATVVVPALTGETEANARALLTAAGLSASTTLVPTPAGEAAAGTVISSSPAGGSDVEAGSTVRLTVSSGPICPDQVGLASADAVANLEGVGLTVNTSLESSRTVADDTVISCSHTGDQAALIVSSGPPADLCAGIVGLTRAAAEAELAPSGLPVNVTVEPGSAPAGQVTACSATEAAIALTVSGGPAPECPTGVAGQPAADAEAAILAAGFATVTTTVVNHPTIPKGAAVACQALSATEAQLSISDGPEAELVVVPDLAGRPGAQAAAALEAAGLTFGGDRTIPNTRPAGEVVRTIPAAGSEVEPGTAVEVLLSSGAEAVTVPNVIGRTQNQATNALQNVGLIAVVETIENDTVAPGTVFTQAPAAGTSRPEGSRVTITVATAPPP